MFKKIHRLLVCAMLMCLE